MQGAYNKVECSVTDDKDPKIDGELVEATERQRMVTILLQCYRRKANNKNLVDISY